MENRTIGEVSSLFQVSARMLRYYEKAGLLKSTRREGYAYRLYDADAVQRVQQIIILRKLQIPLKQIRRILEGDREEAVKILQARIRDMNENVVSLCTTKKGLERLLTLLQEDTTKEAYADFARDDTILKVTAALPLERHHLREEKKTSMAKEMVEKASCVRIVLLPPCTVAAYQFTGDAPEETAGNVMDEFIRSSGLYEKKPDARLFGFNHPDPEPGSDYHGYEEWLTIPDSMELPRT